MKGRTYSNLYRLYVQFMETGRNEILENSLTKVPKEIDDAFVEASKPISEEEFEQRMDKQSLNPGNFRRIVEMLETKFEGCLEQSIDNYNDELQRLMRMN